MILQDLLAGFAVIANPASLLAAAAGLVAGIVVGALPGLTTTMAVAVLLPFTFFMDATVGIPFLLGVYKGGIYGGSIPAIMINTPGTAAAAATCLDGSLLAQRGDARRALEMALVASVAADLLATLVLIFLAAPLAAAAIRFGPPEFTLLYLISLTMIAAVSGRSLVKGLLSAGLGALIACVGLDPMSGVQRFTFGSVDLLGGIALVPLLIGMFALSEILVQAERAPAAAVSAAVAMRGGRGLTWADLRGNAGTILRSSGIGVFIGALPGLGAEIACWIAYGVAKRQSRNPEAFGKGSLEGVAAAEAGNNAVVPAALIPMLCFGIPGDTITAVLLGGFMAQGLLPGPLLFQKSGAVVYGFFAVLLVTNAMLLVLGFWAIRALHGITRVPAGLLYPAVAVLCFAGAYAVNNSVFDLVVMLGGGLAGYAMRKAEVPIPPLVIAVLLSSGLENALRQTLLLSDGSLAIFATRPISAALLALLGLGLAGFAWRSLGRQPSPVQIGGTR